MNINAVDSQLDELKKRVTALEQSLNRAVKYDETIRVFSEHPLDTGRCLSIPDGLSDVQNFPCKVGNVAADPARSWWRIEKKQ
jgi:hypothetical protein